MEFASSSSSTSRHGAPSSARDQKTSTGHRSPVKLEDWVSLSGEKNTDSPLELLGPVGPSRNSSARRLVRSRASDANPSAATPPKDGGKNIWGSAASAQNGHGRYDDGAPTSRNRDAVLLEGRTPPSSSSSSRRSGRDVYQPPRVVEQRVGQLQSREQHVLDDDGGSRGDDLRQRGKTRSSGDRLTRGGDLSISPSISRRSTNRSSRRQDYEPDHRSRNSRVEDDLRLHEDKLQGKDDEGRTPSLSLQKAKSRGSGAEKARGPAEKHHEDANIHFSGVDDDELHGRERQLQRDDTRSRFAPPQQQTTRRGRVDQKIRGNVNRSSAVGEQKVDGDSTSRTAVRGRAALPQHDLRNEGDNVLATSASTSRSSSTASHARRRRSPPLRPPLSSSLSTSTRNKPAAAPRSKIWKLTEDPCASLEELDEYGQPQPELLQQQYSVQLYGEYDRNLEVWRMLLVDFFRFRHKNPEKIKELVRRGLPECLRGSIWQKLAQSRELMLKYPKNLYEHLKNVPHAPCEPDIRRDTNRTFPKHVLYCDRQGVGQAQLLHVLRAYSIFNPEVGYCQGMGFIVGLLLTYLPEEAAFFMLVSLLENYRMSGLFKPNLPLLSKYFFQLNLLIKMHLPKVYDHLLLHAVEPTMYASQWFMTVCIYQFRYSTVCRVWDVFLAEGVKIIFRVALAILKLNQESLLQCGFEDILQLLKLAPAQTETETLIQTALGIKLKASVLKDLEQEFLKSQKQGV